MDKGPRFYMLFAAAPPKAAIKIAGAIKISKLMTEFGVHIELSKKGFFLKAEAMLLGIAKSKFDLSWSFGMGSFRIKGSFDVQSARKELFKKLVGLAEQAVAF